MTRSREMDELVHKLHVIARWDSRLVERALGLGDLGAIVDYIVAHR